MKRTPANIARLWFGADTPLRSYQIKMNADLWAACEKANKNFVPPSGALDTGHYRKSDKAAFVRKVQQVLSHEVNEDAHELAMA